MISVPVISVIAGVIPVDLLIRESQAVLRRKSEIGKEDATIDRHL